MLIAPYRNAASVERATEVFRRFAQAKWRVFPIRDAATAAIAVAMFCGAIPFLIQFARMGLPVPFPELTLPQALAGLAFLVLLNGAFSWTATRWSRLSFRETLVAGLPWLSFLRRADGTSPTPSRDMSYLQTRKSYFWRRLETSLTSLIVRYGVVPLLYLLVAGGLARQTSPSSEYWLSYLLQAYVQGVGAYACYRGEKLETRGKLTTHRFRPPLWPSFLLPWGLSVIVVIALLNRVLPRNILATTLFFDRRGAGSERWTSERELLPRLRRSELNSKGLMLEVDSLLRVRTTLLTFQMVPFGILWPFEFTSLVVELSLSLLAITAVLVGFLLKNRQLDKRATRAPTARIWLVWGLAAGGSSSLGFLLGSACGLAKPEMVAGHIAFVGLGGLLASLLIMVSTAFGSSSRAGDLSWFPVLLGLLAAGMIAALTEPHLYAFEPALLWGGVAAWVLALPIGLAYQHLFFEPFHIRDLWRRDLSAAARWRLLPICLALVLPLGGLANAVLAIAAQERDERLQLWWENRPTAGGNH